MTGPAADNPEAASLGQSIWAHKPWWCQPWTIIATGSLAIGASWLLMHRWWISIPLAASVLVWWWMFLVLVPAAYRRGELGN